MDIPTLSSSINAAAETPLNNMKEEDRLACLAACNKLQQALESPLEAFIRFIFGAHQGIALRLGVDMKLLDSAVAAGGSITIQQLAANASADADLVRRIVRILVGMKLFREVEKDTYIAEPLAAAFVPPSPLAAAVLHMSMHLPALASLPEYFEKKGYKDPSDAFDGPWQYTNQTSEHYFDSLAKKPKQQEAFNIVMGISRMARGEEWFDFYPVEEKLRVQSPSEVLLVDVGGGIGHDLANFHKKFPNTPGRLVLEDLPTVVEKAKDLPPKAEVIGHNFFDPQPSSLKNAKAFYLRTVLHDWPDKQARMILKHIHALMSKDSVLLINENSIPETDVPLYSAQLDLVMMTCFSSLDRTEKQFTELLDSAGFQLLKVWRPQEVLPGSAVLFEAMIKP